MSGDTIVCSQVLSEVGEAVVNLLPQAVGIAALQEFYKNYVPCGTYIYASYSEKLSYFRPKSKTAYNEWVEEKDQK
jgi:hypothetical protein